MNASLRPVCLTIAAAFGLWFLTFALGFGNFWLKLTCSALLLAAVGLYCSRGEFKALFAFRMRHLWVGIGSALVLFGIFWVGKEAANLLFPFAPAEIASVYRTKSQLDAVLIGLLLLFLMGPAEEIYWRGFVQRRLAERYGPKAGFLWAAGAYTLIHVTSWNFMLLLASGVCGLFWGFLYLREQNLIPVIISHSLWDVMIFVLFPMA